MPVPWKCDSLSKVNPFLFFFKCMMTRSPCSWWWLNRETNNNFVLILSAKTNNYNISLKKRLWNTHTKISHGKISLSRFFWFSKLVHSLHADRRTCHTRPTIDFLKKLHVLSISRIKTVCDVPCGTKFLLVVIFAIFQRSAKINSRRKKFTANIFPANIYSKVNIL